MQQTTRCLTLLPHHAESPVSLLDMPCNGEMRQKITLMIREIMVYFLFFFFRASISTLYYSFDFIHNLLADISMTISSFWRKLTAEADLTRVLSKAEGSMLMWQHTAFNFSQNTNKKWWVKKCTTFNLKPLSAKSKSGANSQWILPFLTPVCEKYQHVPHLPASSFFCYLDSNLKEVNSH